MSKQLIDATYERNIRKEQINKKGYDIRKQREEVEELILNKLGHFYFNFYKSIPVKLDRQFKFRFIYLCCFLKYGDNRVMRQLDNNRYIPIKEGELMELLKLSKTETFRTKTALTENKLITINKNNEIEINNKVSFVGEIEKTNKRDYTRIFKEGIKELYNKSNAREHKKLYLFMELLPFIHFKYNIICKNPTCQNIENIEPYTPKELSDQLSLYTGKNTYSLKKQLLNTFVGGEKAFMMFEDYNKKFFVVNPKIYYRGNNKGEIEYLMNIFKIK